MKNVKSVIQLVAKVKMKCRQEGDTKESENLLPQKNPQDHVESSVLSY